MSYTCPFCKTEYKLKWKNHEPRCYLNPLNIKLFARWIDSYVKEKSTPGAYSLEPLVKEWDEFCKENDIVGAQWILDHIGRDYEIFEAVAIILEHGIQEEIVSHYDISPEVLFLYDEHLFLPAREFEQKLQSFDILEHSLLSYQH